MKKKISLLLPVVWSIGAIIWVIVFCIGINNRENLSDATVILQGMAAMTTLIGAVGYSVVYVVQ